MLPLLAEGLDVNEIGPSRPRRLSGVWTAYVERMFLRQRHPSFYLKKRSSNP